MSVSALQGCTLIAHLTIGRIHRSCPLEATGAVTIGRRRRLCSCAGHAGAQGKRASTNGIRITKVARAVARQSCEQYNGCKAADMRAEQTASAGGHAHARPTSSRRPCAFSDRARVARPAAATCSQDLTWQPYVSAVGDVWNLRNCLFWATNPQNFLRLRRA